MFCCAPVLTRPHRSTADNTRARHTAQEHGRQHRSTADHTGARSTAEQEHGRTYRSTAKHTPHARRHARHDIPARQTNNRAYFTCLVGSSDSRGLGAVLGRSWASWGPDKMDFFIRRQKWLGVPSGSAKETQRCPKIYTLERGNAVKCLKDGFWHAF